MKKKNIVGVFDSGIGGLSILSELHNISMTSNFIYFADTLYNPYGDLKPKRVFERSFHISQYLIQKSATTIIIACNTATTIAIERLRIEFPDTNFIGIEPGLKPSVKSSKTNRVGVFATKNTLNSQKYKQLKKATVTNDIKIYENSCLGLVELVESCPKPEVLNPFLIDVATPLFQKNVDTIILGSTHFALIEGQFTTLFPQITFINPAKAVARQFNQKNNTVNPNQARKIRYLTTDNLTTYTNQIQHYLPSLYSSNLCHTVQL